MVKMRHKRRLNGQAVQLQEEEEQLGECEVGEGQLEE